MGWIRKRLWRSIEDFGLVELPCRALRWGTHAIRYLFKLKGMQHQYKLHYNCVCVRAYVYKCLCVHVCACMYICACVCEHLCMCMCVCAWMCEHLCVHVFMHVDTCVCMCVQVPVYVCVHACGYVCVWFVYAHVYAPTFICAQLTLGFFLSHSLYCFLRQGLTSLNTKFTLSARLNDLQKSTCLCFYSSKITDICHHVWLCVCAGSQAQTLLPCVANTNDFPISPTWM